MRKLNIYNKLFILFFAALIVIIIMKAPRETNDVNNGKGTNHLGICLMKVREFYFPGQGNPLEMEDSVSVIMACTNALRAEMKKRGRSDRAVSPMFALKT